MLNIIILWLTREPSTRKLCIVPFTCKNKNNKKKLKKLAGRFGSGNDKNLPGNRYDDVNDDCSAGGGLAPVFADVFEGLTWSGGGMVELMVEVTEILIAGVGLKIFVLVGVGSCQILVLPSIFCLFTFANRKSCFLFDPVDNSLHFRIKINKKSICGYEK